MNFLYLFLALSTAHVFGFLMRGWVNKKRVTTRPRKCLTKEARQALIDIIELCQD